MISFSRTSQKNKGLSFRIHSLHLTKSKVVYFLFFLSFIPPSGINYGVVHYGLALLKYIMCAYILCSVFLDKLLKQKYIGLFIIYYLIISVSTIVSDGGIPGTVLYFISNIVFLMLIAYMSSERNIIFFYVLKKYITILLVLNIIIRVIGILTGRLDLVFIAIENHQGIFYVFALFIWSMDFFVYRNKRYMVLLLIIINVILYSGDTMKILLILFLVYLLYNRIEPRPRLSPLLFMVLSLFLFIGIVFFSLQSSLTATESITFTGRTYLWEFAIETLGDRPMWILGYGTTLMSFIPASVINPRVDYLLGTHNDLLYRIIMGGPIVTLIFIVIYCSIFIYLYRKKGLLSELFSVLLFIMFIHHMLENTEWELFFPMIIMIYYFYICRKPLSNTPAFLGGQCEFTGIKNSSTRTVNNRP